jgi:hypothetical protein
MDEKRPSANVRNGWEADLCVSMFNSRYDLLSLALMTAPSSASKLKRH